MRNKSFFTKKKIPWTEEQKQIISKLIIKINQGESETRLINDALKSDLKGRTYDQIRWAIRKENEKARHGSNCGLH